MIDLEFQRQLINLSIIVFAALAIGFVLRKFLKLAWRVTRIIILILILLLLLANAMGWMQLPAF